MELIKLPRMRHNELQSLAEATVRMCNNQTVLTEALKMVTSTLARFKASMQKEKTSQSKQVLDKKLDRLISGLMYDLKAELYFPHTEKDMSTTKDHLLAISKKYGTKISRLPMKEESAAVDNLLVELGNLETETMDSLSLSRWVPLITNTNNELKQSFDTTIEAEVSDLPSPTEIAPDLYDALDALYSLIYAHARIGTNEQLVIIYKKVEELIDSIN